MITIASAATQSPTTGSSQTPGSQTATSTTVPVDAPRPADDQIGPGVVGFLATFVIAVGLVVLVRDMNRRIQRLRYGATAAESATEPGATDPAAEADEAADADRASVTTDDENGPTRTIRT